MAKKVLATIAVISFAGLAIFGFLGVMDHAFNTCLIKAIHGGACPGNVLRLLNFHLDALKVFSSANLSVLIAALLAVLLLAIYSNPALVRREVVFRVYFQRLSAVRNYGFEQISRWLTRHETSPTFIKAFV